MEVFQSSVEQHGLHGVYGTVFTECTARYSRHSRSARHGIHGVHGTAFTECTALSLCQWWVTHGRCQWVPQRQIKNNEI